MTSTFKSKQPSEGAGMRRALALSATVAGLESDASREAIEDLLDDILRLESKEAAVIILASLVQRIEKWRNL